MKMQTINRKDHIPQLIVIYPSDAKMVPNSQTNQCDMLHPKRSMKHLKKFNIYLLQKLSSKLARGNISQHNKDHL